MPRKIVFSNFDVCGNFIKCGVLSLKKSNANPNKLLVICDIDTSRVYENCIPVPHSMEPLIFENWMKSLVGKTVWPIPKGYIRNMK